LHIREKIGKAILLYGAVADGFSRGVTACATPLKNTIKA
jgi:hypothetical protein